MKPPYDKNGPGASARRCERPLRRVPLPSRFSFPLCPPLLPCLVRGSRRPQRSSPTCCTAPPLPPRPLLTCTPPLLRISYTPRSCSGRGPTPAPTCPIHPLPSDAPSTPFPPAQHPVPLCPEVPHRAPVSHAPLHQAQLCLPQPIAFPVFPATSLPLACALAPQRRAATSPSAIQPL